MVVFRFVLFILLYAVVGSMVLFIMKRLFITKKWEDLLPRGQDIIALAFFAVAFWPLTATVFFIWLLVRGFWLYAKFLFSMDVTENRVTPIQLRYRDLMASNPSKDDIVDFCERNLGTGAKIPSSIETQET